MRKSTDIKTGMRGLPVLVLAVFSGCIGTVEVGELQTVTHRIELQGAESVSATIELHSGTLRIAGGDSLLLQGVCSYNVASWKPEIDYLLEGTRGNLRIYQPSHRNALTMRRTRNEWDLRFNRDVPLHLEIDMGAGKGELTLAFLSVITLDLNLGAGEVRLDLTGNESLERLNVSLGAGSAEIDLAGTWDHDLTAEVDAGVGELTVRLPESIGVLVNVDKAIGGLKIKGLRKEGEAYINDAYGASETTIRLLINTGVGQINLEVIP